jgi:membrane fusion protein, multidrug efflux system
MEKDINPKKKKIIVLGVLLLAGIAVGGYKYFQNGKVETTDNAQVDGDIVSLRAGTSGYIADIRFSDNALVKEGDTLVVFKTIDLLAKVQQAEAALQSARGMVGVATSRANAKEQDATAARMTTAAEEQQLQALKTAVEQAEADLARTTTLSALKAATEERVEHDQTALKIATANYAAFVSRKNSLAGSARSASFQSQTEHQNIEVSLALVKEKEAALLLAQEAYSRAFILAPFPGIVTRRTVQEGQYVSVGQAMCAVVNTSNVWITANFKELQLQHLKPGQPVEIFIDAFPDLALTGKIESFGGATGSKFALVPPDNATGNFIKISQRYPVRISVDDAKSLANQISPGLSAFVRVKTK